MSREDNEQRRQADKRATIEQARHLIENVNSQLAQRRRRAGAEPGLEIEFEIGQGRDGRSCAVSVKPANGALATVFGDR